jgi:hypothetical protein
MELPDDHSVSEIDFIDVQRLIKEIDIDWIMAQQFEEKPLAHELIDDTSHCFWITYPMMKFSVAALKNMHLIYPGVFEYIKKVIKENLDIDLKYTDLSFMKTDKNLPRHTDGFRVTVINSYLRNAEAGVLRTFNSDLTMTSETRTITGKSYLLHHTDKLHDVIHEDSDRFFLTIRLKERKPTHDVYQIEDVK